MHIEFHKINLENEKAHEKHTQDEMHLKNYLVALIKETHFQNWPKLRGNAVY